MPDDYIIAKLDFSNAFNENQQPFDGPIEGFTKISPSDAVLLDAPLGPSSALESALDAPIYISPLAVSRTLPPMTRSFFCALLLVCLG